MAKKPNPRTAAIQEMIAYAVRLIGQAPDQEYISAEFDKQVAGIIQSLVDAASIPTHQTVRAYLGTLSGISEETREALIPAILSKINHNRTARSRATAPRPTKE